MEEILKYLGNWGKYQLFVYFLCFLPFFLSGCLTLMMTFTAGVPNTRIYFKIFADAILKVTIITVLITILHSIQMIRSGAKTYCKFCNLTNIENKQQCTKETAIYSCSLYIYDKSQYKSSVVTQFNMVCDGYWMGDLLESLFMAGVLFGAGILGVLGDKIGRRKTFIIAALCQIVVLNVTPIALNYYAYSILQIITGALQAGTFLIGFTVVIELFGGLPKTIFGIWVQGMYTIGYFYVALVAYFIRDWQYLSWSIYVLSIFYIPLCLFFPESIRWLAVNNRKEEAKLIVERAAMWNGVIIPDEVLEKELSPPPKVKQGKIIDLLKNRTMAIITFIIFFTWATDSLAYYGLSWNTASLPGNPYVNFVLFGLVELPAYVICIPFMEIIGRRLSLVGFLFVGGISCIISGLITQKYAVIVLTNLGKLCVAAAFAITYNYTAEIFPTAVRNAGTGFGSLSARIGSIAAPQISLLAETAPWIPVVIFGSFGVVASILDLFLPETKNKQMPDTVEEGIEIIKNNKQTFAWRKLVVKERNGEKEKNNIDENKMKF